MNVKKRYVEIATDTICKIDPDLPKNQVTECIESLLKQHLKDPTIVMDNNVTGEGATISLSKLCGWIENEDPVISGNATFYTQPKRLLSPTSHMLRALKKGRKAVKKKMFQYKAGSDEYAALDLNQQNKKVIMNAEYGGSGTPTAAFYTKYSPAATTLMAQSIITTMAAFFEGYVGDNAKFFNANECFDWMNKVCEKDDKVHKWIVVPSREETARRIYTHFYMANPNDYESISDYVNHCSEKELVYLYYANNYRALIANHPNIQHLLSEILIKLPNYEAAEKEVPDRFKDKFKAPLDDPSYDAVEKYNKWMANEMFMNPYEIPECIKDEVTKFVEYMSQYVYVEYITPDSIVKLNNHKRNTVMVVDTDSNMINANLFAGFIMDEIFPGELFGRKRMYDDMILCNVLAACLDKGIKGILDYYGRCHHMDDDSRAELTMKNEFLFRTFFMMNTKKRYAASIVLREGNIMVPFKPEIKGMDFIKAGVTKEVSDRFKKILCDHILYSDHPELHELMNDLKQFERDIYEDIHKGGVTYYKQTQYKNIEGYKDPNKAWSLPVFKGSAIWNKLYPNKKIYSLDRVRIVKLNVRGITDIECIKNKYLDMYNKIVSEVFMTQDPHMKKAGFSYVCLPNSVKEVPKWMIPLIDDIKTVSDIMSSFKSVLEALKIEDVTFKRPNGDATITSALISL